ncbi:hypothetical protein GOBAR_AA22253 [Gossypium barbadense]|uniref:CCHC-type domain-containing protein n=1 Tax=Gossypium barbadense TaxID=3634 RepID=A0A2P5X4Z6_GOSBA|nr:hypothetical protein GOBAR_AA22253 [Gossypium barbadense]
MLSAMENSPKVVEGDGDSRVSEDRNTKKVRFKDGSDRVAVDMAVDSIPSSSMIVSWKDKLLGSGFIGADQGIAGFDEGSDGDFILLEDDVIRSTVNGLPAIDFSDRVKQLLYKEMEMTVVLKLLGRNISYGVLFNRVCNLWKPIQPFQLMDIENGYYLAKFQNNNDYEKVLTQGLWIIFGQYLTVQPWTKDFSPFQPYPSVVMAWIRLPGLPGFMYKRKILEVIGSTMGLPTVCFACGKYGHVREMCSLSKETFGNEGEKPVADGELSKNNDELGKETESAFRPWMLVEHRSRRRLRDLRESGSKIAGKERLRSRFDSLINEGETSGGEKGRTNEYNRGLITQSVEIEMNIPDSRDKGIFKIMPNSHNGSMESMGIDSEAQKRIGNAVTVCMGKGALSGQEMNSLRLKSLGKRSKNDAGSDESLVGSHSKTSPIGLGPYVCPTNDGPFASCASLNLRAVDNHENRMVGKQNTTLILSRPINYQQQFHAMSNADNSQVPLNFDLNCTNFKIENALLNIDNFVNGVDSNLQAKNLDEIKAHFNPAFEGPFESKGRTIEFMSAGSAGTQDQKFNGKFGAARGGHKNSNVLRGRGSRFKASTNSRVSLADFMEEVAKLISSDLSKEVRTGALVESDPSDLNDS